MLRMKWVGSCDYVEIEPRVLEEIGRRERDWERYWGVNPIAGHIIQRAVRARVLYQVLANVSLTSFLRERVRLAKGEYLLGYVWMDEHGKNPTYRVKRISSAWAARLCEIYQWPHEVGVPEPDAQPKADEMGSERGKQSVPLPLDSLRPSWRRAWLALEAAQSATETQLTYEQAWEWLRENGIDGYKLPAMRTYSDYCAKAAKQLDEQRKKPRGGRDGRSIVKQSEL